MAAIDIENYLNDEGFFDHMADDVREGLSSTPKMVPPKYFYDDLGSGLFEQITEQPEYYPMREEGKLLVEIAGDRPARCDGRGGGGGQVFLFGLADAVGQ